MSDELVTEGDGKATDGTASPIQGAIEELTSRKSATKACRTCRGRMQVEDGTRCPRCHGSGIDPQSGKDAAGSVDLTTK